MKLRHLVQAILITLIISQAVYAVPKGKPFEELNSLIKENAEAIDENGELIEQNSTAILALSTELSNISGRVDTLETGVGDLISRFDGLEAIVEGNSSRISTALAKINSVQTGMEELTGDVSANSEAIASTEANLSAAQNKLAAQELLLEELNASRDTNNAAIENVTAKIAIIEGQIAALDSSDETLPDLQADLTQLNDSWAALVAMVNTNDTQIAQTETNITTLQNNISTLFSSYNDLQAIVNTTERADSATIEALKANMSDLIFSYEAQKISTENELAALNNQLLNLAEQNSAIATDLQSQMLTLSLLANSDSTSISALQIQVSVISGTLTLLNARYNNLSARYLQLTSLLNEQEEQILLIIQNLLALNSPIDQIRESFIFHDKPDIDETGHIERFKAYVRENPYNGPRWVWINFVTGDFRTEYCVYDDADVFRYVREGTTGYNSVLTNSDRSIYRHYNIMSNGAPRYSFYNNRRIFVNYKNVEYPNVREEIEIFDWQYKSGSTVGLRDTESYYEYLDTKNWGQFLTYEKGLTTDVVITFGQTRLDACGY